MNPPVPPQARADGRYCIVASRFNGPVTDALVEAARACLVERGATPRNVEVVRVPGAWELPLAVSWVIDRGSVDGVIALGCVIRGETPHFEYVSMGATIGLEAVARESGIPVAFGVLTTDDGDQARARAGGSKGNKGEEAALALLDMCEVAAALKGQS
jgi:6,7-dimethyl-8-ribityllumazine synthase